MAQQWYYINASKEKVGPISPQALKTLAQNGIIKPGTALQLEGNPQMVEAGAVSGLFAPNPSAAAVPRSAPQQAPQYYQQYPAQPGQQPVYQNPAPNTQPYPGQQPNYQNPAPNYQPYPGQQPVYQNPAPNYQPYPVQQSNYQNPIPAGGYDFPDQSSARQTPDDYDPFASAASASSSSKSSYKPSKRSSSSYSSSYYSSSSESSENGVLITVGSLFVTFLVILGIGLKVAKPFIRMQLRQQNGGVAVQQGAQEQNAVIKDQPIKDEVAKKENKGRLTTEEVVSDAEGSVALIQGKESSGSGFVVLPGIIATNFHVIESEFINELEIFFPSEEGGKHGPFTAELLYCHPDRDIAFLKLNSREHKPLAIVDDYRFRRGQGIIVIGSPGRGDGKVLENAVSEGVLSTKTKMEDYEYYQLGIAVNPGNSGGPVLNDEGFVIGVVTLKATAIEATAYCIPPDELRKTIETVRKGEGAEIQKCRKLHDEHIYIARGMAKATLMSELGNVPVEVRKKILQEGLQDLEKAVQRAPNNPLAWFLRGVFKAANEDLKNGLTDLDKAVELARILKYEPTMLEGFIKVRDQLKELIAQSGRDRRHFVPFSPNLPFHSPRQPYNPPEFAEPAPREMPIPRGFPGRRPPFFDRGEGNTTASAPELTEEQKQQQAERNQRMLESRKKRYEEVIAKEDWLFNGKPLKGTLVGYDDREGMARFKLKETGEVVNRYVNRFTDKDIEDIRTYALHHHLPTRNLRRR